MITLFIPHTWTPCICKKHILFKHLKKLIDTITLICTDKKNTTSYYTNVDSMSTDTPNEIKHLIKQLNQISAQCEQNNYSTKTKCIFLPVPVYQMKYISFLW